MKECPSCGSQIAEAEARCSFCKSSLGQCAGCGRWIVEGMRCLDCGKTTRVRVKPAPKASAAAAEGGTLRFEGSALGIVAPLAARFVLVTGTLAAGALALAAAGVGPVREFATRYVTIQAEWPVLAGMAGVLFLLAGLAGGLLRRVRLQGTAAGGQALEIQPGVGSWIATGLIALFVLPLTAGLGLPWIYSRTVRSLYRRTLRAKKNLDFRGTGEEVLGRFLLTLLLLPAAVATGGFLFAVISWMWLRWEQSNLLVPDRNGQMHRAGFTGTFGGYFARFALGWVLTLATGGLYRPWAKAAEWRWAASHTQVPN
jgi:hypothetical protein